MPEDLNLSEKLYPLVLDYARAMKELENAKAVVTETKAKLELGNRTNYYENKHLNMMQDASQAKESSRAAEEKVKETKASILGIFPDYALAAMRDTGIEFLVESQGNDVFYRYGIKATQNSIEMREIPLGSQ